MVLNFADKDRALAWIAKSMDLNARAKQEMIETSKLIQEINEESQGSLVDEIVHVANGVINVVEQVAHTVNQITDVMSEVTGKIANAVDTVTGYIGKIASIFG